jgi:plastocyanin
MRDPVMRDPAVNTSVRTPVPVVLLVLALLAFALFALGCGSSTTTTTTAAGVGTTTPAAAANAVTIAGSAFSPASITVKVGDAVTWTNNDSVSHTVTADDNSFASSNLANGAAFSFTFTKAGSFPYHCSIHPSMTGTVVVQ